MPDKSPAAAKRKRPSRPSFDPRLRYRIPDAALLLDQSEPQTWIDIREGRLAVIREGKRTFVPGSEIVRRCSLAECA